MPMLPFAYVNPQVQTFAEFIENERNRYTGESDNLFAFALGCIFKRYKYVWSLKDRSQSLIASYIEQANLQMQGPNGPMSEGQLQRLIQQHQRSDEITMWFECFLMYASIMCDEIAYLILHLFGEQRGIQLGGHRKLSMNFAAYAGAHGLSCAPALPSLALYVEKEICDFRDKQIVHDFHPRKTDGLSWNNTTLDVSLHCAGFLYPKESDKFVVSKGWNELSAKLDEYVWHILALIRDNAGKSRYVRSNQSFQASASGGA
jgi:hypothetical protein